MNRASFLSGLSSRSKALRQLEPRYFLQHDLHSASCIRSRGNINAYAKSIQSLLQRRPLVPKPRELSPPVLSRRFKSTKAKAPVKAPAKPARLLGDEPPLFDSKPQWWARWVFVLLGVDMLFTGFSIDMVMRNWTEAVEKPAAPGSPQDKRKKEYEYVLRPLWQRLGLSSFEMLVGVAAGALILASRDRTVWRVCLRRVPLSSLPPSRSGMQPLPLPSAGPEVSGSDAIVVLTLETGSGRSKRFLMRDCTLAPGRDLSELYLRALGVRGNFILSLGNARVVGLTGADVNAQNDLRQLIDARTEDGVAGINVTPGGGVGAESVQVSELRRVLARAWILSGGTLSVPGTQGWTSGPVTARSG
ncbi:hypothetical protein M0805_009116 [Coniferiporia weirii]|nr:hypothetical protein M0805_009116 [Coniferiporia weirii]